MKNLSIGSLSLLAVASGIFLSACNDDVTNVTNMPNEINENSGMDVVASAASLGTCDSSSVGKTVFVTDDSAAYVCAGSSWYVLTQKTTDGKSCTAEFLSDSSGYKILCGGDSVGVVLNGKDGSDGADGKDGSEGKTGTSCSAEKLADGTGYKVVCGGDSVGVVLNGKTGNGCSLADNGDGSVTVVCGEDSNKLYKALCGNSAYDPSQGFCFENSIYDLCDGKIFDPGKEFCAGDSVYALCGNSAYDPSQSFCFESIVYDLCDGKAFDPNAEFCFEDSLYALCGGKSYDPSNPLMKICYSDKLFGEMIDSRDGNKYRILQMGAQTWMAENLNYDYSGNNVGDLPLSVCLDYSADSCAKYGRLYIWSAAMDSSGLASGDTENANKCGFGISCNENLPVRGVCPEGWHLPDTTEWKELIAYVEQSGISSDLVGNALKSREGWVNATGEDGNGNDIFGFEALPANYMNFFASGNVPQSEPSGRIAEFWSSVSVKSTTAASHSASYVMLLKGELASFSLWLQSKVYACSVRCVKD